MSVPLDIINPAAFRIFRRPSPATPSPPNRKSVRLCQGTKGTACAPFGRDRHQLRSGTTDISFYRERLILARKYRVHERGTGATRALAVCCVPLGDSIFARMDPPTGPNCHSSREVRSSASHRQARPRFAWRTRKTQTMNALPGKRQPSPPLPANEPRRETTMPQRIARGLPRKGTQASGSCCWPRERGGASRCDMPSAQSGRKLRARDQGGHRKSGNINE